MTVDYEMSLLRRGETGLGPGFRIITSPWWMPDLRIGMGEGFCFMIPIGWKRVLQVYWRTRTFLSWQLSWSTGDEEWENRFRAIGIGKDSHRCWPPRQKELV